MCGVIRLGRRGRLICRCNKAPRDALTLTLSRRERELCAFHLGFGLGHRRKCLHPVPQGGSLHATPLWIFSFRTRRSSAHGPLALHRYTQNQPQASRRESLLQSSIPHYAFLDLSRRRRTDHLGLARGLWLGRAFGPRWNRVDGPRNFGAGCRSRALHCRSHECILGDFSIVWQGHADTGTHIPGFDKR